ncbi:MAG: preprotein translocase subunit SecA [Gammaproteobacteria bacterium]|nr:preprotein translocase subunit SecA [Gammaproteobacteria bacterium]
MITRLLTNLVGSRNERVLKRLQKHIADIHAAERAFSTLDEASLRSKTDEFKDRLAKGASLESLLPEAFAVVRILAAQKVDMRPFDVQLIGGIVLHQGKIAEMQTGEGKTLVATLPAYLNALTGKSVHIVTVNDYLAQRDAKWMGPIYEALGLSVGVVISGLPTSNRQEAYAADVVYGTNNEFGFDYLRDNMAFSLSDRVQRDLSYAIVDEVDSILIDEARTPLIISGQAEDSSELYQKVDAIVRRLKRQPKESEEGDYTVDEKARQVLLTEAGNERVETLLVEAELLPSEDSLYNPIHIGLMHYVTASLRAHALFARDIDYIVRDNQIIIIDEHTGRMMPGRRWSDGLHQAVEAMEKVKIQSESQTLASITFQNYFRLYQKLAGMTGTADTEAAEFHEIYHLEVIVIPPNKPNQRKDHSDLIFMTREEKFNAVISDIEACRKIGEPVLVGTTTIETSEYLSDRLNKLNIPHQVLNAKYHEKEAVIIAQAGRPGTVTIATNMAGRGTDIVLGGNVVAELAALENREEGEAESLKKNWQVRHETVVASGGLHIIGSERHESRRIDNQLRGRSARQGDPGSSRFYLSLDDNLIRIFASERMVGWMKNVGVEKGEAIEHRWLTRAIENAQRKVEGRNFEIRKQLLEFDDVANEQRKVVYTLRQEWMATEDVSKTVESVVSDVIQDMINLYIPFQSMPEQWNLSGLESALSQNQNVQLPIREWLKEDTTLHEETLRKKIEKTIVEIYRAKEGQVGAPIMRQFEKAVILQGLDKNWREHLVNMDHLRQGIHLRGYANRQPMQEYKREAYELFSRMLDTIKYEVTTILCKVQVRGEEDVDAMEEKRRKESERRMQYQHQAASVGGEDEEEKAPAEVKEPYVRNAPKVGRNSPCSCGSGKKYKHCCGKTNV